MTKMASENANKGKERITITIEKDLLEWLDKKVESKIFANRSHGFEYLIKRKLEEESSK